MPEPLTDDRLAEIGASYTAFCENHSHTTFACCSAHATAEHVPDLLAECDRLRAENAELRAQLATAERQTRDLESRYIGQEPTVAEEMDYLTRCRDAVLDLCDAAELQAGRWAPPLPIPDWVPIVRAAAEGMAEVRDPDDVPGVPA